MALMSHDEQVQEKNNPFTDEGRALLNKHKHEQDEINQLNNLYQSRPISKKERRKNQPKPVSASVSRWRLLISSKARNKASLLTVILILFGGGGAMTMFMSPSLAIVQLKELVTKDLNDQIKAFDTRSQMLLRAKLSSATKGSCGVIVIKCKFANMSEKRIAKLEGNNFTVEKGKKTLFGYEIKGMTHVNPETGVKTPMSSAEQFTKLALNDPAVRADLLRAYNPWYYSVSDGTAKGVIRMLGASKKSKVKGNTDEEREKSLNSAVGQGERINPKDLTPERDKDGKPTGRYIGPDGVPLTQDQINSINESATMAEQASKVKPSKIISSVGKAVLITGVADSACTAFNAMRKVGEMAKTIRSSQAAQFALAGPLSVADEIKAGVALESTTTFIGNKINNVGAPTQPEKIIDESRIGEANTLFNPPMIDNPKQYNTAFDGAGPMAALHGEVKPLDSEAAQFSLAGGFIGTMAKVNEYITRAVTLGLSNDPQVVSQKCKYIQNPYVRGAALAAGIFVGLGSLGMSTVASASGSLLISMALPYALSMAADIIAGDVFKNLSGESFGNGTFVGAAAVLGSMAKKRGGKPLSSQEAAAYTNETKLTYKQYEDAQQLIARSEPFNIYNEHSFLGSIATVVAPVARAGSASAGTFAMSLTNLIPASLGSLTGATVSAASGSVERFSQCEDPTYKRLNIGADIFCNVRYGYSEEELTIDPIENADWMASTGNITATSDGGEARDNGQKWNYAKYLKECVDPMSWGEPLKEDDPESDGTRCLSEENEPLNKRFRIFTLDKTVDLALADETDEVGTKAPTGGKGLVGSNGWAYPTIQSAYVSDGGRFDDPGRDIHKGVDLIDKDILGKPIYAAHKGTVVAAGPASGFGNWIVISDTIDGREVSTVYGHMYDGDLFVKVGDKVEAGQPIGKVGSNGNSTGPHLHFEIWDNGGRFNGGRAIDPLPIINAAKSSPGTENRNV